MARFKVNIGLGGSIKFRPKISIDIVRAKAVICALSGTRTEKEDAPVRQKDALAKLVLNFLRGFVVCV